MEADDERRMEIAQTFGLKDWEEFASWLRDALLASRRLAPMGDSVEDAVHAVFMSVLRRVEDGPTDFASPAAIVAYGATAATREWIRSHARDSRESLDMEIVASHPARETESPMDEEGLAELRSRVEALEEPGRSLVKSVYFEGRSLSDIANAEANSTNENPGRVRRRLESRLRRQLLRLGKKGGKA